MFNWEITVFDIMIEGLIVSSIWQYLSYKASKHHEKHLQNELDELYNKLIEARDEAKEAKEKADK